MCKCISHTVLAHSIVLLKNSPREYRVPKKNILLHKMLQKSPILNITLKIIFHVSFTFLVLLFWTFLVRFSGPPTPSCQKEQENHKIGPQMSRIGTRKVKETQKIAFWSWFLEIWPKNFLTRYARQKSISACISRNLDQK